MGTSVVADRQTLLACGPDNRKVGPKGWRTRRVDGRTQWIPPPALDTGQPRVNDFHHPQRLLLGDPEPDGGR